MKVKEESERAGLKLNIQRSKIMARGLITPWQIGGETMETVTDFILGLQNHCRWWLQPWNEETLAPWKKSYDQPRQHIEKQRNFFADKGPSSQGYGFSSSHVWMWDLDYKESWAPKSLCFWTMLLEMTLESPLDCKEIRPVNPKGNQLWILIGRTDAEAEAPKLWPPDVKNWLIWKVPEAGQDWRQKEKGKQRLNCWMASTQWTWVWASSSHWWWKWRPGVLQSMGSQTEEIWGKIQESIRRPYSFLVQREFCLL